MTSRLLVVVTSSEKVLVRVIWTDGGHTRRSHNTPGHCWQRLADGETWHAKKGETGTRQSRCVLTEVSTLLALHWAGVLPSRVGTSMGRRDTATMIRLAHTQKVHCRHTLVNLEPKQRAKSKTITLTAPQRHRAEVAHTPEDYIVVAKKRVQHTLWSDPRREDVLPPARSLTRTWLRHTHTHPSCTEQTQSRCM